MGGVSLAMLVLLLFSGMLYLQQPSMIFYPSPALIATPDDWGLPYQEVGFTTSDGKHLHGWYLPHDRGRQTLLFLHGNAGNISHRGDSLRIFHRLGFNVLIFDYRGYGHSEGEPSEEGLYRDARAAWRYLVSVRGVRADEVAVFGRSLGGVVAANLAAEVQPAALIVESSFSSARELSRHLFPVLSRLAPLRYEFDAAEALRQVKCPVMVAHSTDDEIIPYEMGERLYQAAKEPKYFLKLQGDHNAGFLQSQPYYEQSLQQFLNESIAGDAARTDKE